MITFAFFTSLFISQNVLVDFISAEQIMGNNFHKGIVPYYIETSSYDPIIVSRIQTAMDMIEASSCVVFKQLQLKPTNKDASWVHFMNPEQVRECVHEPSFGPNREIIIILGYECMMLNNIMHAVLHAIGFKDEVSHPHREQYMRIMWENIQPRYRKLFQIQREDEPYKSVEYDPMSIMHFHDRAFSINGALTVVPRVPGLLINPSDKLSQLDVMKLRLWFGHECNKRKVGALLEKCKTVLHNNSSVAVAAGSDDVSKESVEANLADTNENLKDQQSTPLDYEDMGNKYDGNAVVEDAEGNYGNEETVEGDKGVNRDNGASVNGDNSDYKGKGDNASVNVDYRSDGNSTNGNEGVNLEKDDQSEGEDYLEEGEDNLGEGEDDLGEESIDLTKEANDVDDDVSINEIPVDS